MLIGSMNRQFAIFDCVHIVKDPFILLAVSKVCLSTGKC